MDATILASTGLGTSSIAIIFVLYQVLKRCNGHRLISDCCGKKSEVGFVIDDLTPDNKQQDNKPPEKTSNDII
jgi:hypothetical protein